MNEDVLGGIGWIVIGFLVILLRHWAYDLARRRRALLPESMRWVQPLLPTKVIVIGGVLLIVLGAWMAIRDYV